ncbi:RNA polymerase subunit sigma [Roseobacter denitrificans]|uniref:RNA polymerase sigma factor n=1 Tax=Roseobacter denitrificans (strain ATCC 33942 / OCh 114) TaxID=375451 RepID=Q16DX2_ROSDO|nr:RNA polymerase sigma factor [Roseobacter denitrificans]ABG29821.1 RNA polymerase sigma factor, putative [Roseobacter denitrificans OCh 114]AVL53043.1 RNA polymerase subunit sigma [Roseobacter denitrificans]SFG26418.1 RNA polymerase sigma-70 factor, ECF subfamily [Roseobacter denitrificans OCh 114]
MNDPDPRFALLDHLPAMRGFATSLTRDSVAADDVVQDAVIKAWTSFDQFQPGTNLRAWLFTILRNTFYSSTRKSGREVADVDGVHFGALAEKPAHDGRLQMTDFRSAFAQLPDEQREALLLVGASGFSYEEAAEMCGVAVGTIKSRTGRGRQRLAELMQLEDEEALEMTDDATLSVLTAAKATTF